MRIPYITLPLTKMGFRFLILLLVVIANAEYVSENEEILQTDVEDTSFQQTKIIQQIRASAHQSVAVDSSQFPELVEAPSLVQTGSVRQVGPAVRNPPPRGADGPQENSKLVQATSTSKFNYSAALAEYFAMLLFVVIGCGSAMGIANLADSAWVFQVSLTFGFAITSLAYAVGHISGGHINCAVTFGLVLAGHCSIAQGLLNFAAQMFGSITGALVLLTVYPQKKDLTGALGSNCVNDGFTKVNAFIGELLMTFLLVFVVLETATNPLSESNRALAPVAIGLAVFLAHSVLIPIDGCSINPTRSFGPAVVATFARGGSAILLSDMWIFWLGPLLGAAAAAGVSALMPS